MASFGIEKVMKAAPVPEKKEEEEGRKKKEVEGRKKKEEGGRKKNEGKGEEEEGKEEEVRTKDNKTMGLCQFTEDSAEMEMDHTSPGKPFE